MISVSVAQPPGPTTPTEDFSNLRTLNVGLLKLTAPAELAVALTALLPPTSAGAGGVDVKRIICAWRANLNAPMPQPLVPNGIAPIAGLPARGACVRAGPPLSASVPNGESPLEGMHEPSNHGVSVIIHGLTLGTQAVTARRAFADDAVRERQGTSGVEHASASERGLRPDRH